LHRHENPATIHLSIDPCHCLTLSRTIPMLSNEAATHLIRNFDLKGEVIDFTPLGNGHIHHTWLLTLDTADRYVFQNINTDVFQNLDAMMDNMNRVTAHINSRRHGSRRWQSLRPQTDMTGAPLHKTEDDDRWRCCAFVEKTTCHDRADSEDVAYQAGRGFGMFQADLADLSGERLHDTLPRFHDTPWRFACLDKAIANDAFGRCANARTEVDFARSNQTLASTLMDLHAQGDIPERVTHNDTKINNILLDAETNEPVCVVDLDTVMPGLSLYDFGDLIRSAAGSVPEDHQAAEEMHLCPNIYTQIAKGFLDGADGLLLPIEVELMPFSAKLITLEIGVRFLTDYLEGDHYFNTTHEHHNLERCRTQFALAASIASQEKALQATA
jgi:hypothetical protein